MHVWVCRYVTVCTQHMGVRVGTQCFCECGRTGVLACGCLCVHMCVWVPHEQVHRHICGYGGFMSYEACVYHICACLSTWLCLHVFTCAYLCVYMRAYASCANVWTCVNLSARVSALSDLHAHQLGGCVRASASAMCTYVYAYLLMSTCTCAVCRCQWPCSCVCVCPRVPLCCWRGTSGPRWGMTHVRLSLHRCLIPPSLSFLIWALFEGCLLCSK